MKHRLSKRIAIVLAACVTCVLAFGVTLAKADVDSGMSGNNKLLVSIADNNSGLAGLDAQVNMYRVATATKDSGSDTYKYDFKVEAFSKLGEKMAKSDWEGMAAEGAKIVRDRSLTPDAAAPAGQTITGLPDGIYLVLIPDVASAQYSYSFAPQIVSLPGKVGADGKPVYNTSEGRWTNSDPAVPVEIVAKPSMDVRYGRLEINKTVTDFSGEGDTFVYRIADTQTDGKQFEAIAAINYTANGAKPAVIERIPAGMEVTVTEVNTGARYQVVSEASQTVTIVGGGVTPVSFENEPNGSAKGGHGIENHFVFDQNRNGGDWQLEVHAIDVSEYAGD